ncbi:Pseudouridine kinase [Kurthia zopfii]|uniref:Pseudouridine kinase n=1 Tax=Kurthia zopfii TaxID=1650 RepID=A0A8B4QCI6_9BACL|nr:sugar/nucleoside kinase (ribokinase family) [Kurthia zopfii]STX10402.1 Pseudouridine kinase [Kurthia zopfii]VEI08600.1 Pseudouridine kinase [Kurthia zopfii]
MTLTEREQALIQLIKANPFMSQQDMADHMKMSRPALANLISGLVKKGKIVGRAYVLPRENNIICIGGANIDRKLHVKGEVQMGTSNPVYSTQSVGGVARNIAENLGRLDNKVALLTTAGKDTDWQAIVTASEAFINLDDVEQLQHATTGSYTAIMDEAGELVMATANMDVYEDLKPRVLMKHDLALSTAPVMIIDLNCPKETVEYVQQFAIARGVPLVIVPVSSPKMDRLTTDLQGVTWFICNTDEAETLLNTSIKTEEQYKEAVTKIIALGAENVIITAGAKGVYAANTTLMPTHFEAKTVNHVEDVTGAGDAFVAAVVHAWLEKRPFEQAIEAGLINAKCTLESPFTVRPELTKESLENELED